MKEEIYTIPVMDGMQAGTECPFCAMLQKLESDSIGFVLSPSYMEEDVRGATNEQGFCKTHLRMLYEKGNSLGLALMMHSHLKHRISQLDELSDGPVKKGWFSKKQAEGSESAALREKWNSSCFICDRMNGFFRHYLATYFYLWKKDPAFQDVFKNGKGYCLDHYLMLLDSAANYLSGASLEEFLSVLKAQEKENLTRVADELEWFTLKFDYRYTDKPWGNSKDALPRTILKVNGQFVDKGKTQS